MTARTADEIIPPGESPALAAHEEQAMAQVDRIAKLFDYQVRILGIPVGLDGVLGLIPGIGDAASGAVGLYFLHLGRQLGLPKRHMARMVGNLAFDTVLGTVPVVGDIFDFGFKAHRKNAQILRAHVEKRRATAPQGRSFG